MNDGTLASPRIENGAPESEDGEPQQIDMMIAGLPGGANNVQEVYRLSPLQEGMLFHRLLNERGDTYVLSTLFELPSRVELDALLGALQSVVGRHDVLRTAILWERLAQPLQVVHRHVEFPVQELLLDEQRAPLACLQEQLRPQRQMFDLQRAPLLRVEVTPRPYGGKWYALLRVHHLVCDHLSLQFLVSEVLEILDGREQSLPAPLPYHRYVSDSLAKMADDMEASETYFRSRLAPIDAPTAPFGLLDVHGDGSRIEEAQRALAGPLADLLRSTSARLRISPARLLHAAWAIVVAHTSGRDDIVYGTVVLTAQQRGAPTQRMLGMAVNTLPLRLELQDITVAALVEQANRELKNLLAHEQTPLALAQRCSGVAASAPLFTSLLNCRRTIEVAGGREGGARVLARGEAWTNYPVTLIVDDDGQGFSITAQTDRQIVPQRVLAHMECALQAMLEALRDAPQTPALALSSLPAEERRLVLKQFNPAATPSEQGTKLIHELFQEQVRRAPHAPALTHENKTVTYDDLNKRANQVAHYLRGKGLLPDQPVGICVERSIDMVVGLLGILKAGGAYVPIDPEYPPQRMRWILDDSAPHILLASRNVLTRLPQTISEVVLLDDCDDIAAQPTDNLTTGSLGGSSSHHLAYVIYTSGSTGRPKGVMVEHRNVTRLFEATNCWFGFNERDVWSLFHSYAFDFSVWELWGALFYGGRVVIVPHLTARSAEHFYQMLCEQRVTVLNQTPSAFVQLIDAQTANLQLSHSLRLVIFGGEALDLRTLRPWVQRNDINRPRLVNMYGITETTVHVTYRPLTAHDIESERASVIGEPIPDLNVYLLNRYQQPVPFGAVGEMYVGGAGVARGYLNRPDLTVERFVADPFAAHGARLYRSGDLARWRADGTLEYLGRNDMQVKIRGFRIELGEIEAQLTGHPCIKEAVVIAREDTPGERQLVAYVIATSDATMPPTQELRAFMKRSMPEYMIPSAFVLIERIPLTPNGKLDRHALPKPERSAYANREYEPPRGEVEQVLAAIWQSLLRVDRVGRTDNFFELGGHSLLIVEMLERLRRAGLVIDVRRVFVSPTLADLAYALGSDELMQFEVPPNLIPSDCDAITPQMVLLVELAAQDIERIVAAVPGGARNVQDIYPLAPLQEGLLFHHVMSGSRGDAYVVPTLFAVASEQLEHLIGALQAVIDRHDVLRTAVLWEELRSSVQVVYRTARLPVEYTTLDASRDITEQLREWLRAERQRLDLRQAPLLRLRVAADPQESDRWYVLLQFHHMIGDNTSQEIVFSEVVAHMQSRVEQLPVPVPYRNHVAQARAHAQAHDASAFFRGKLADVDEPTAPYGILDVHSDGSAIEEASEELERPLSLRIRAAARRLGVSAATLLHAAWALVVAHASGRSDVVFGTVLLGRLQGNAGAQRILGMFINTLPLRLRLDEVSARELIELTQRELVELLGYEQTSLAVAQRCSGIVGSAPLFTALLNYRHGSPSPHARWANAAGVQVLETHDRTNYPIMLSVDDLSEGFVLAAQTQNTVDPRRVIAYVRTALQSLLDALEQRPQALSLELGIIPEAERLHITQQLNATQAPFPNEQLPSAVSQRAVGASIVRGAGGANPRGDRGSVRRALTHLCRVECTSQSAGTLSARQGCGCGSACCDPDGARRRYGRSSIGGAESGRGICAAGSELSARATRPHARRCKLAGPGYGRMLARQSTANCSSGCHARYRLERNRSATRQQSCRAGCRGRSSLPGIRDLYLWLDGQAQGSHGHASGSRELLGLDATCTGHRADRSSAGRHDNIIRHRRTRDLSTADHRCDCDSGQPCFSNGSYAARGDDRQARDHSDAGDACDVASTAARRMERSPEFESALRR
jgi:amino acid adenylation domain-containing protein